MKRFVAKASCPECGANGEMHIAADSGIRAEELAQKFHNRGRYTAGDGERDPNAECKGTLTFNAPRVSHFKLQKVGSEAVQQ